MAEIKQAMHGGHLFELTQPPTLDADMTWRSEWCDAITRVCVPVAITPSHSESWHALTAPGHTPVEHELRCDTPEPAAVLLVALGLLSMLWWRARG